MRYDCIYNFDACAKAIILLGVRVYTLRVAVVLYPGISHIGIVPSINPTMLPFAKTRIAFRFQDGQVPAGQQFPAQCQSNPALALPSPPNSDIQKSVCASINFRPLPQECNSNLPFCLRRHVVRKTADKLQHDRLHRIQNPHLPHQLTVHGHQREIIQITTRTIPHRRQDLFRVRRIDLVEEMLAALPLFLCGDRRAKRCVLTDDCVDRRRAGRYSGLEGEKTVYALGTERLLAWNC